MLVPNRSLEEVPVTRVESGESSRVADRITVEEPLEIRVRFHPVGGGAPATKSVSVTMRTPGDDFELAAGFLFGEALVRDREDIHEITYCTTGEAAQEYNIVSVRLRSHALFDPDALDRNFYMTSSCGVCGKASLEAVEIRGCAPLPDDDLRFDDSVIRALPGALREAQSVFPETGAIHAAALFDARGTLVDLREDVGRHNAVDKVVGKALLDSRLPLAGHVLAVSGRSSFEITQKALAAEIPAVVAVGAPSTLAVDLARRFNLTLVGFVREEGYNVYAGGHRLGLP